MGLPTDKSVFPSSTRSVRSLSIPTSSAVLKGLTTTLTAAAPYVHKGWILRSAHSFQIPRSSCRQKLQNPTKGGGYRRKMKVGTMMCFQ